MLDAVTSTTIETEDKALETAGTEAFKNTLKAASGVAAMQSSAVFAASMMMAPFAMAQASALAARRGRALARVWGESAMRCRNANELIDVNRRFGERAIALGAGEIMRVMERSAWLGRAAVSPESFRLRDSEGPR